MSRAKNMMTTVTVLAIAIALGTYAVAQTAVMDDLKSRLQALVSTATPATLTLTYPNGGENLAIGVGDNITWTVSGLPSNVPNTSVALYLYRNGKLVTPLWFGSDGTSHNFATANGENSASNWGLGGGAGRYLDIITHKEKMAAAGGGYKIKAMLYKPGAGVIASDESDNAFSLYTPAITVTQFQGTLYKGATYPITWTSGNSSIAKVNIGLKYDRAFTSDPTVDTTIAAEALNSGSYQWTVPTTLRDGKRYIVTITDATGKNVDASGMNSTWGFTVAAPPPGKLTVASDAASAVQNVRVGQKNATFATVRIANQSSTDISVSKILVEADAANADRKLEKIRIVDESTPLASISSLPNAGSSNGVPVFASWGNLTNWNIPANGTKVLSLIADVKSGAPVGPINLNITGVMCGKARCDLGQGRGPTVTINK